MTVFQVSHFTRLPSPSHILLDGATYAMLMMVNNHAYEPAYNAVNPIARMIYDHVTLSIISDES